jgi:hypothetical protein
MQGSSLLCGGASNSREKRYSETVNDILNRMEGLVLMQHEFLFLLTNSVDRLDLILKGHKVDFK